MTMSTEQFQEELGNVLSHPSEAPHIWIHYDNSILIDGTFTSLDQLEKVTALLKRYYTENGLCPF